MEGYENLAFVLSVLAGPTGATAWFIVVSNFMRNGKERGWFDKWVPWTVQLLVIAVSLSVPWGAYAIVQYIPASAIEAMQGWYSILFAVSFAYLVQQGYYVATKEGKSAG